VPIKTSNVKILQRHSLTSSADNFARGRRRGATKLTSPNKAAATTIESATQTRSVRVVHVRDELLDPGPNGFVLIYAAPAHDERSRNSSQETRTVLRKGGLTLRSAAGSLTDPSSKTKKVHLRGSRVFWRVTRLSLVVKICGIPPNSRFMRCSSSPEEGQLMSTILHSEGVARFAKSSGDSRTVVTVGVFEDTPAVSHSVGIRLRRTTFFNGRGAIQERYSPATSSSR
jgi:hypothetical protein